MKKNIWIFGGMLGIWLVLAAVAYYYFFLLKPQERIQKPESVVTAPLVVEQSIVPPTPAPAQKAPAQKVEVEVGTVRVVHSGEVLVKKEAPKQAPSTAELCVPPPAAKPIPPAVVTPVPAPSPAQVVQPTTPVVKPLSPEEPIPPVRPGFYKGPGRISLVQNGKWLVEIISSPEGIIERAENPSDGILLERIKEPGGKLLERISDSSGPGVGIVIERIQSSAGIEERVLDGPRKMVVQRFDDGTTVSERVKDLSRIKSAEDVILNREERKDDLGRRQIADPRPPKAPKYKGP